MRTRKKTKLLSKRPARSKTKPPDSSPKRRKTAPKSKTSTPEVTRPLKALHAEPDPTPADFRPAAEAPQPNDRRRRPRTAREWSARSSPVVEILDDAYPLGALRRFLDSIKGPATEQQAQIALGAAQLLLLPIARESRGGVEVKELVDLMLERWTDWGAAGIGFHGQEFLRNAFAAVGVDRRRIAELEARVAPAASNELLLRLAAAHAVARDKVALLRCIAAALHAGTPPSEFRRDVDFAPYATDPDVAVLLATADVPAIEVDIDPHIVPVRHALDALVGVLTELGLHVELRPPVRPPTILEAERTARLSLPNDYRALLTITNGMRLWDREFLGIADYRDFTLLTARAHQFLHADYAFPGVSHCVPLANWGHPNDWLLYDPRGQLRGDQPGYAMVLGSEKAAIPGLVEALSWLGQLAQDASTVN